MSGVDRFRWDGKEIKHLSLAQFRLLQVLTDGPLLREPVAEEAVIGHVYEIDASDARQISDKRRAFTEVRRRFQEKLEAAKIRLHVDWGNKALQLVTIPALSR
jgi:hypothetical protein